MQRREEQEEFSSQKESFMFHDSFSIKKSVRPLTRSWNHIVIQFSYNFIMINYSPSRSFLAAFCFRLIRSLSTSFQLEISARAADEFAKSEIQRHTEWTGLVSRVWGTKRSGNYFNRRSLKQFRSAQISCWSVKGQTCLLFAVRVDGAENKQNHFLPKEFHWKFSESSANFSLDDWAMRAALLPIFHARFALFVHAHFHEASKNFSIKRLSLSCGKVLADKVFNLHCFS